MESLTKNKKTNHEITNIFYHCLGTETDIAIITELTAGSFNAVYKITLSNGKQYVLKIAPHAAAPILRNEKNIMQSEAQALHLVKQHTSVPVPRVLFNSEHLPCCDSPILIMEWMPGKAYQYTINSYLDETKKNVLLQLGSMTSELHQIHSTAFGTLGKSGVQFPTWDAAFSLLYQNILADGIDANVPLPFDYDYLFQLGKKTNPYLKDVVTPCLIHGDLWLGNVLVHNKKISALLDFERSLWGDPLMEYPFGLLRNNVDFLNGYEHFILDNSNFSVQIRRALYNLYHYLIVKIEKPYRGFKSGNSDYFVNQKIITQVKAIEKLLFI